MLRMPADQIKIVLQMACITEYSTVHLKIPHIEEYNIIMYNLNNLSTDDRAHQLLELDI